MEELKILFGDFLLSILGILLTALAGYLGKKMGKWMNEKNRSETAKDLAKACIQAVEQMYKEKEGKEKMERAKELFVAFLNERGILLTAEEIQIRLEAAVYEWKRGYESDA